MDDSSKIKLDNLVNEFHQYSEKTFPEYHTNRRYLDELFEMKEHWKNGTNDSEGKIPTAGEITYFIYYLRWNGILPF